MADNTIQSIGEELMQVLEVKNKAREMALPNSRATIRNCAQSIRASHRGELETARRLLNEAGVLVAASREALLGAHPDIYWAGYVQDAQKEYSEASVVLAVIGGVLGCALAVGYTAVMVYGLRTWWLGAIGTTALRLHVVPETLVYGFVGSVVVALLAVWWAVRRWVTTAAPCAWPIGPPLGR